MAELPWKSFAKPVPDREYVAILTYLPLKNFSTLPQFFYYTARIQSQMKSAPGLIGYSLVAICCGRTGFVRQQPHQQARIVLRRYMATARLRGGNSTAWRCRRDGAK